MATVTVNMRFCEFVHRVTVALRDDGDLDVEIDSPCDNVRDFAKNLGGVLTMADVTERAGSRLTDPDILQPLTLTCLVPNGIYSAAWLELGMLARSRAELVGFNEVRFTEGDP